MDHETYICAACGGEFTKAWSDEEAQTELLTNFGEIAIADCDIVCDDCYVALTGQN